MNLIEIALLPAVESACVPIPALMSGVTRGHLFAGMTFVLLLAMLLLLLSPVGTPGVNGTKSAAEAAVLLPSSSGLADSVAGYPNVVLIVTDDQPVGYERFMPNTSRLFSEEGVAYSNAHSLTSTCCPSRATLLTGLDSPQTGVWTNWAPNGGWEVFHANGWDDRTLATSLDRRGYRTALIGKYLNGYDVPETRQVVTGAADYIPPGWDYWFSMSSAGNKPDGRYYDYNIIHRDERMRAPSILRYTKHSGHYSTDVLGKRAVDTILRTPSRTPLFLVWAPSAPHKPFVSPPGTKRPAALATLTPPASLNQSSGKPPWVSDRPPISSQSSLSLQRQQVRTLQSVDRWVAAISGTLKRTGRWNNTIFVFVSDNGFMLGQYGLLGTKNYPYPGSTNVPLFVAAPTLRSQAGTVDNRLVTLADIPATIAAAVGLDVSAMDGIPLTEPLSAWRAGALIAGWRNRGEHPAGQQPSYCAWRDSRWLFVQYSSQANGQGYRELYDLLEDPQAVTNLAGKPEVAEAERTLERQTQDACSPSPPDFVWPDKVLIPLTSSEAAPLS